MRYRFTITKASSCEAAVEVSGTDEADARRKLEQHLDKTAPLASNDIKFIDERPHIVSDTPWTVVG